MCTNTAAVPVVWPTGVTTVISALSSRAIKVYGWTPPLLAVLVLQVQLESGEIHPPTNHSALQRQTLSMLLACPPPLNDVVLSGESDDDSSQLEPID